MEAELANYATSIGVGYGSISMDSNDGNESSFYGDTTFDGDISLFSIENQASGGLDARRARESLQFIGQSISEVGTGISLCGGCRERKRSTNS